MIHPPFSIVRVTACCYEKFANFVEIIRISMKFRLIIAAFIAVVAAACGDDTQFRVTGEVQGLGTRTINMFYVADGAVHQEVSRQSTVNLTFTECRANIR